MATEIINKKKEVLKLSLEKISLSDAGVKNKYGGCVESSGTAKSWKNKLSYPTLWLNSKEAPDLKGSDAGQEKTLVLKAIVQSHELNDSAEGGKNESFRLEIKKIGVIK